MDIKRIVFWQNIISPHQIAYIRELPYLSKGKEILLVAAESTNQDRAALGWNQPDMGRVKVYLTPDSDTINTLLSTKPKETVHCVGGLRHSLPYVKDLLNARKKYNIKCGTMVEAPDPRGYKGILRKLIYRYISICDQGKWDFMLTMGEQGAKWYKNIGWNLNKTYCFGYTTEALTISDSSKNDADETIKILFVGQLVLRKGVDILIKSLAGISPKLKWHLDIAGTGNQEHVFKRLSDSLGLNRQISFLGQIHHTAIGPLLKRSDLLAFPSRFDGWGAVINESLMAGTPVLCSCQCGGKDLITFYWRGEVLESGNLTAWSNALSKWISKGRVTESERLRIQKWSECINGVFMGSYFLSVLENVYRKGERPIPPWI
jgi:glycosyltransferase involved in cell wall biosynthesis